MVEELGYLKDEEIFLKLYEKVNSEGKKWVPAYKFQICLNDGTAVGLCDLRLGNGETIYYSGNIGYSVEPIYRGNAYAKKACLLLFKLAKRQGMKYLLICCDPDNIASRRTCENAGAKLIEIADLPKHNEMYLKGERQKCIYKVWL